MTSAGGELATAPIFDDRLYLTEALLLGDSENEEDIDAQLTAAARERGIEDPDLYLIPQPALLDISTAIAAMSLKSEPRSSLSIHSRETQSTTQTSLPSRHSRDKSPMSRMPHPLVRASFSTDRNEATSDHFRTPMRHRHSASACPTSMSLPNPSLIKSHSTRKTKRASGLFSMFRRESSTCSSRPHHVHHFKPQSPKLECGHSHSKYAIRVHVQEALEKRIGVAPTCCGRQLPRDVLGIVLTGAEVDLVTDNIIIPSPDEVSLRDSGYSENGISSVDLPHILDTQAFVAEPSTMLTTPTHELNEEETERLHSALQSETYQQLRAEQREQFQRISNFEANQRQALSANHQHSLEELTAQLEISKAEAAKQHAQQLERLDEFQLRMEHDLRSAHDTETQNVATALKHMEAYCSGPNPAHPDISYTVTDEDRKTLERQRIIQEKLPAKHESAINVLRAKQERDTIVRTQKHQSELEQLEADYENNKRAEELQYEKDVSQLDATIQTRRRRILRRWNLKFEIWRRNWEEEHSATLRGPIPHEEFPEPPDAHTMIDPLSPLAVHTGATV
ncbi:hypothetical protein BU23DRAFT_72921 [Bimuria novae-zelandiae CBS 107.79]|uniref:Uncharacterized protein n=1 Tax=Bimuria novae-zelandiae CBS 107.79 TaxID=1447943 RepID=A0A6A5VFA8_9PLEO|nr:hypothetical protein BU23DRAFT_72921 [Bimuria novae-zelandiae CBS 107.79]